MHTAPVQVTVVEYVSEFFRKYKTRAYGKSISINAKGGADALMGMLKLVLSKGGKEELRIALHCFKDQLTAAAHSTPAARSQQVEELFALLSSLVDAAERLRQFSPVKEGISCAVLEEVRWRLFRVLAGDGFSEAADIRRRALDLVFLSYMREQSEHQQQQQRHKQLAAGGAAASNAAAAGFTGGSMTGRPPGSPSKAARLLQGRASGITGPDVSSWEGLWCSLTAMSGRRMLPLLQSVMADLYLGKHIPGTPAATAAASTAGSAIKAGTHQHAAKQQQQQPLRPQLAKPTRPAANAVAACTAGTARPAVAAVAAAVAAAGDEAACGVHTPPQRSSDNDAPESFSSQQPDEGGSLSSVDAAAVVTATQGLAGEELVLQDFSSEKQQQQQLANQAEADDTDTRDEGAAQAVDDAEAEPAAAVAHGALQDTAAEALLEPALTADGELPAGVVYAPVLDRSTWVSCASSSFCPTETGSIDGSAFALSDASLPVCASAGAAGYGCDSAEGAAVTQQQQQQQQACGSPCSSPPGPGRSRFAAKLERLKESVKESVSIGGGSGSSSSGSGGPAWKQLPRAWVQQLRHGHDKDKEKEQQQQQHEVSDIELDQQQPGVDVDQAAGSDCDSSRAGVQQQQQQGRECIST